MTKIKSENSNTISDSLKESEFRKLDPEPIAIITLCVATIAMAGTVSNAIINYKKYFRDGEQRSEDAAADFIAKADRLYAAGEWLRAVISLVDRVERQPSA